MRRFAIFILTHGRPDRVTTYRKLAEHGYTGATYLIIDNEDAQADRYRAKFGADRVIMFDKKAQADRVDEANNFDNRKVIVHARNACFDIAESLGLTHFLELDDDYITFLYRFGPPPQKGGNQKGQAKLIRNMDGVLNALLEFYDATPCKSLAISQGGDHIGGFAGERMSRKAMNFFICSTARRFTFLGSINEDVNTYTRQAMVGDLFFTFYGLQLNQEQTQKQAGGMTDIYLKMGTYVKSFSTVLFCPSSVKVSMMTSKFSRMHHTIDWAATCPQIVPESTRKGTP